MIFIGNMFLLVIFIVFTGMAVSPISLENIRKFEINDLKKKQKKEFSRIRAKILRKIDV